MNPLRVLFYFVTKDGVPCSLDRRLHTDGILVTTRDWNAAHHFEVTPTIAGVPGVTRKQAWTQAAEAINRSVTFRQATRSSLLESYPPFQSATTPGDFEIIAVYSRVPTRTKK